MNKKLKIYLIAGEPSGDALGARLMKGGILIPDSAKEKPQEFRVIALGTGKVDDKGKKIPFDVKVGDIVLTSRYGGTEVKVGDKEYKVVNQDDILAIVG